jgi:hypothetical protein
MNDQSQQIHQETLVELLAFSYLSNSSTFRVFGDICCRARVTNAALRVGGVLLFDGFRFCQLLVGKGPAVVSLAKQISEDHRHEQWRILAQENGIPGPMSENWSAGFCEPDDLSLVARFQNRAALDQFRSILPRADLFP